MKANQKSLLNEEEAVSPVIAVILMVAITVVLAATVFVLVNDLGKNVGSTGPSLGLVSDSAGSSTSQWTVKVSSATQLADLNDYRFILTSPSNGTMVFTPDATNAEFLAGYCQYVERQTTDTGRGSGQEGTDCSDPGAAVTATQGAFRMGWTDIDGNGKWSVGDKIGIQFTTSSPTFGSTFPTGSYQLEVLHTPSGSSSGSLPRTF